MTQPVYGHLRAAQADRERAVDVLKAAFAEGRLDHEEYAQRVGLVFKSRTYGELAVLTADLPVGPLGTLAASPSTAGSPVPYLPPTHAVPPPRKVSGMAITSFVLALAGIPTYGIASIFAIPFAVGGGYQIARGDRDGAGIAVLGFLISALTLVIAVVYR